MSPSSMARQLSEHQAVFEQFRALEPELERMAERIHQALTHGGCLYTFGNGGSAADAQHFAAELVGRFRRERGPLRSIALTGNSSTLTCIGNDYSFDDLFARQLDGYLRPGDLALGISTSGKSENVFRGLVAAKARGVTTLALTGNGGGKVATVADLCVTVPSPSTARIQEMHLVAIHLLCERIDELVEGAAAEGNA